MDKLSDWINSYYLDRGVVEEMKRKFQKDKQVLLSGFLRTDAYHKALALAQSAKFKRTFVPDEMSCAFAMKPDALLSFLASEKFVAYIELITGIKSGKRAFYTEFKAGDYALIKDLPQTWKLVTHLFISPWNPEWGGRLVWRDVRGNHLYTEPVPNCLLLTKNQKHLRGFVQYVNHHAGKHRFIAANV